MYRDNIVADFFMECVAPFVVVVGGLALTALALVTVTYATADPPSCRAKGAKMGLEVSWEFWTGCMINLQGQWLSDSDVVPVERDGRIVFAPKPQPIIQLKSAR